MRDSPCCPICGSPGMVCGGVGVHAASHIRDSHAGGLGKPAREGVSEAIGKSGQEAAAIALIIDHLIALPAIGGDERRIGQVLALQEERQALERALLEVAKSSTNKVGTMLN